MTFAGVIAAIYGRTFWGVQRTTFIVDSDGMIAEVLCNVKPAKRDDQVLAALATAESPAS